MVLHVRHVPEPSERKGNLSLRDGTLFEWRIVGFALKVPQYPTSVMNEKVYEYIRGKNPKTKP